MGSFPYHDIRVEKTKATSSRYRGLQRITALIRLVELFVIVIIVSKFSSRFAFSLQASGEYFKGITVTLVSPRFVFLLGNAIVIVLFSKSGRFSAKNGEIAADFYDEYAEKCRKIDSHQNSERRLVRCRSEGRQEDKRTESGRESTDCRLKLAAKKCSYAEDEMSNEEFRRTVEAFIARQQRLLREE